MISRQRWAKLEPTLDRALELGPEEASIYLDRACGEDAALRNEVWRLYRACRAAKDRLSILDTPAGELARPLVEEAPAPQAELRPGEAVGPYRIERPLGRGGMGIVYLAHDPRLDRPVALKFLPPWLAANDLARRRFAREAKAASALDHPNVQTVYEISETEDARPYIALAYYEGETLEERLRRGPLPVAQSMELASQLAEGLRAAHAQGIVHRDLKPGNVIVTPEGVAKILDFGIAEVAGRSPAKASRGAGTLAYMSPEQVGGREVDGRSDLWSLGVVMYEMLAGRRPFPPPRAPLRRDAGGPREAPEPLEEARDGLPDRLAPVVRRCLEEAPEDRYPDADALLADLAPLRGERTVPAGEQAGGMGWIRRFGLRSRRLALLATAGVAALVGAFAYLASGSGEDGSVAPAASTIAVLPFASVASDTSLDRLGRELAMSLSVSLRGAGAIRTIPALSVLSRLDDPSVSPGEAADLARRLGATGALAGGLARIGPDVRLDLVLYDARNGDPTARVAVSAPADDVAALSDSATFAILRSVWREGKLPALSLAALTTASVPALRAYLEGEEALARGEFRVAADAFGRAHATDSTFWFAYWRHLLARKCLPGGACMDGEPLDSATLARALARRDALPAPDRMWAGTFATRNHEELLNALRRVTRSYPDYWPAWWQYGAYLKNWGPYLGTTRADARAALERTVTLNPTFDFAWMELWNVVAEQHDAAGLRRVGERWDRLASAGRPGDPIVRVGQGNLERKVGIFLQWGYVDFVASGGEGAFIQEAARHLASGELPPKAVEFLASKLLFEGYPRVQVELNDAVLSRDPPEPIAAEMWRGKAVASAARGDWEVALFALERWTRLAPDGYNLLQAHRLAVVGAALEAVDAERVTGWRQTLVRPLEDPEDMGPAGPIHAWMDGLLAWARGDTLGLAAALKELSSRDGPRREIHARSLEAFRMEARGDRQGAARSLAALEWENARNGEFLGWLAAVHRIWAARWLHEEGDPREAELLLRWHEAILYDSTWRIYGPAVEPLALLERGRTAEARDLPDRARKHYAAFLERYDRAGPAHAGLVEEARAALRRLSDNRTERVPIR